MENHSIVWVGMDTDAKKNQISLYRGWDREPAAEWEAGMDGQGIKKLIERLHREKTEIRCVYEAWHACSADEEAGSAQTLLR